MATIDVEVRLFAKLREICRADGPLVLTLSPDADASSCFRELCKQFPGLEAERAGLVVAINEEYAEWGAALSDRDVVTFIPPVSGG